jgi:hypothetical protein
MEEPNKDSEQPLQKENNGSASSQPDTDDDPLISDDKIDLITDNYIYLRPTLPTPQMINLTKHQMRHTPLQKEMTIYFQECSECPPSVDPIHTAMVIIDATASSSAHSFIDDSVDKYLPAPQSFKAILKLNYIQFSRLHAINMEIKTLIDHDTFTLGQEFCNDKDIEAIIQIAQNGNLTCKTRHIKQYSHHVCQDQQVEVLHINYTGTSCVTANLLTSSNKANKQNASPIQN